jgi:hypothetical protein
MSPPVYSVTLRPHYEEEGLLTIKGVRLVPNLDGRLVVTAVVPDFTKVYGVQVGMEVLKINNVDSVFLKVSQKQNDGEGGSISASVHTCLEGLSKIDDKDWVTLLVQQEGGGVSRSNWAGSDLVTAVLFKEGVSSRMGIGLRSLDPSVETGIVMIEKILPPLLSNISCPLKAGMRLISINNTLCYSSAESVQLIKSSTGQLTFLAQKLIVPPQDKTDTAVNMMPTLYDPVTATLPVSQFSQPDDTAWPLSLEMNESTGRVVIARLKEGHPIWANNPLFRPGMELVSVNNHYCGNSLPLANAFLRGAAVNNPYTIVTLVAQQPQPKAAPGTLVSLTVTKPSADTKLGIITGMQMPLSPLRKSSATATPTKKTPSTTDPAPAVDYSQGQVVIRRISPGGLVMTSQQQSQDVAKIPLQAGMMVHQVQILNNTLNTKGLHNRQVSQFLRTCPPGKTVTFLCEVPATGTIKSCIPPQILSTLSTFTIIKQIVDQHIGMSMSESSTTGTPKL